jgi:hypothetical protein
MSLLRIIPSTCAFAVCFVANSAAADLSAEQVWGDWRSYMEGMGYSVSATESISGDTLSVSDISVQMSSAADGGTMTLRMGPLQFVESGTGTVEVVMPPSMPLMLDITPGDDAEPVQMTLDYTQSGQRMIASGDAAAMVYDYSADTFGMAMAALTVDGVAMDASAAKVSVTGDSLLSQTKVNVGDTRSYDQNITLGNLVYDIFFKSPDSVEAMQINSTVQSLAFAGTSTTPLDPVAQTQDLMPLLASGFTVDGTFTSQGSENRIEVTSDEGTSRIKTGSARTALSVAMAPEGVRYDVAAEQVEVGAELAGLPFPLFVQMAGTGFALRAPVMKSDDPQDFALAMNFTEFTMSDIIWALFDPAGELPRDPATIALDLKGKAKVLVDALNTDRMQQMATGGTPPAEVSALDITQLTVDAVGARIDATGAFTFDNTDKITLPGYPKPVGDININIAGANGLLDKLVAMGFLPAEQVMGARMMLGMFAVPGAAPDTLTSRIEFNEEGQILANGQRIK